MKSILSILFTLFIIACQPPFPSWRIEVETKNEISHECLQDALKEVIPNIEINIEQSERTTGWDSKKYRRIVYYGKHPNLGTVFSYRFGVGYTVHLKTGKKDLVVGVHSANYGGKLKYEEYSKESKINDPLAIKGVGDIFLKIQERCNVTYKKNSYDEDCFGRLCY